MSMLLWIDVLRRDVTAARDEMEEAQHELAEYKETVMSLETELNSSHDVESMLNEQVMYSIVILIVTAFHVFYVCMYCINPAFLAV